MLNKWQGIGRLGRNPDEKTFDSGKNIATFSIAVDGGAKDTTEWIDVTVWEKTATNCMKYLSKGSLVYVEGRLHTRKWEKDGEKKSKTGVVAHVVKFLDTKKREDDSGTSEPQAREIDFSEDDQVIPF